MPAPHPAVRRVSAGARGGGLHTPVALVVFNRPEPTRRVFERVRAARPRQLLVIADGPRAGRAGEAERCAEVRDIVTNVDWECELLTDFSAVNLGCKRRVSSGLDWVFRTVEEAIVLEDDCVPHPTFFGFCAAMLERYRHDERVAMVAGTNYEHRSDRPASYLFSRYFAIWGWATWRRAWTSYDVTMADWPGARARGDVNYWYPQPYMRRYMTALFDQVHAGGIDTWDIQWVYACLAAHGLCIVPAANQIANVGYAGAHTSDWDSENPAFNMPTFDVDWERLVHPARMSADWAYDSALLESRIRRTVGRRVADKVAAVSYAARQLARPSARRRPGGE